MNHRLSSQENELVASASLFKLKRDRSFCFHFVSFGVCAFTTMNRAVNRVFVIGVGMTKVEQE